MTSTRTVAQEQIAKGRLPVPIPEGAKFPQGAEGNNWSKKVYTPEDFSKDGNIGLKLGHCLIDVDLDHPWACKLAEKYLPPTHMRHKRASGEAATHYWYACEESGNRSAYAAIGHNENMLVEVRGLGCQTVIPPSILFSENRSPDSLVWCEEGEPAEACLEDLERAAGRLASVVLIALAYAEGSRHSIILALAGFLVRRGMEKADITNFVVDVMALTGDTDLRDRLHAVEDTFKRFDNDEFVTGGPTLSALCGREVTKKLHEWLQLENPSKDGLPDVYVEGQTREYRDAVVRNILAAEEAHPTLFVQSGKLVRLLKDEEHGPSVRSIGVAELRNIMTNSMNFYRHTIRGVVDVEPPKGIAELILGLPLEESGFPLLRGVTEAPIVRPDGSIVTIEGYDTVTGFYYVPSAGMEKCSVPDTPTRMQVTEAIRVIYDLIQDFPYTSPSDVANMYGAMLSPLIRSVISSPIPLGVFDAPTPGSGKGLQANVVCIPATGRPTVPCHMKDTDIEMEKMLTSMLVGGTTIVVIDNVTGMLKSSVLEALLTVLNFSTRLLGKSETLFVPNKAAWFTTGNNIRIGGDLGRRCYHIRIDPECPEPSLRSGFVHEDLCQYLLDHRAEIVSAELTLIRAWYVAGCPVGKKVPAMGSFESWAKTIGGILSFSGIDGFLENIGDFSENANEDRAVAETFISACRTVFENKQVSTDDVAQPIIKSTPPILRESTPPHLLQVLNEKGVSSFKMSLAKWLDRQRDRRYGSEGLYIKKGRDSHTKGALWKFFAGVARDSRGCFHTLPLDIPPGISHAKPYKDPLLTPAQNLSNGHKPSMGAGL